MPYKTGDFKETNINYLNKDFESFKNSLIEYAKTYFPNTYKDFNESSPGMMLIEMSSYVGDVLSFYIDEQFRESLLAYAEERKTVFDIAQSYGYKPKISTPSAVTLEMFQTVPASGTGDTVTPNYLYGHRIKQGSVVASDAFNITFRTVEEVNFSTSGSLDPVDVEPYERDTDTGDITKYLLKFYFFLSQIFNS